MRLVVAMVVKDGQVISVGTNEHKGACKREGYPSGEGYELCEWCNYGNHAEVNALKGVNAIGAHVYIFGHDYCCDECNKACQRSGVKGITICEF